MQRNWLFSGFILMLALWLFAGQAQAAFQNFGPDFAKFKVDVPEGWQAQATAEGCQITSPDEKTSLSIQVFQSQGKSAKEFAKLLTPNLPGKVVKTEEQESGEVLLYCEVQGVRVAIIISAMDEKIAVFTLAGPEGDTLKKILNSLEDAN